jgi:hypothetical protein
MAAEVPLLLDVQDIKSPYIVPGHYPEAQVITLPAEVEAS